MTDAPILSFRNGLAGFGGPRRFHLLRWGDDSPFSLLRSVDDEGLFFVVVPPAFFFPDYEPELDDDTAAIIGLESAEQSLVLVIVTVLDHVQDSTANLLGPLVVNVQTRMGVQAVLDPERWSSRRPLVAAAATSAA